LKIENAINAFKGYNGSPVFSGENVIALHNVGGMHKDVWNIGRLITFDLIDNLEGWGK
jgi:hypothetical protein